MKTWRWTMIGAVALLLTGRVVAPVPGARPHGDQPCPVLLLARVLRWVLVRRMGRAPWLAPGWRAPVGAPA